MPLINNTFDKSYAMEIGNENKSATRGKIDLYTTLE